MTAKGHMVLSTTLAYLPLSYMLENEYEFYQICVVYTIIVISSLLPDIDEPKSFIGNRSMYFSSLLKLLGVKHRTITHWLVTPLIIALFGYIAESDLMSITLFAVAFGVVAHDVGDLISNTGIKGFLFPFLINTKIVLLPKILRFETFSVVESFVIFILMVVNFYIYFELFFKKI